jgi:hypothetical protein
MTEPYRIAETGVADLHKNGKEVFSVDGEPLPWWISDKGVSARKVSDGLYVIHIEIVVVNTKDGTSPETFYHEGLTDGWAQPVIQGIVFPWCITSDGFTYTSRGCSDLPVVELEFFCRSVEGIPVEDPERIVDAQGFLRARKCQPA